MSPFALQMLAMLMTLMPGGSNVTTNDSTGAVRVDTVRTAAGGDFTIEHVAGVDDRFLPVIARLEKEGWPREWLEQRFADKRTVFIPKMVSIKARRGGGSSGSGASAYAWVNTSESAEACRAFLAKYKEIFDVVEPRYGVDRETIAALMRCETRHGTVTGDYHVFSVYASMALMNEPEFVRENVDRARGDLSGMSSSYINGEINRIEKRAASRSKWAYRELVNLLKIEREGYGDAMAIYGSWAGAFGWGQFLPSSYLRRGVDGDGNGSIDLYTPADAIHSVANYLSKAGYRIGNDARRRKAIRSYNPSTPYVNSIVGLGNRLLASK